MNNLRIGEQKKATTSIISPLQSILQRSCVCGKPITANGECTECNKKRGKIQRKAPYQQTPETVPPIVHEVLREPGRPLNSETRASMEPRFGRDFSGVRVHTGARAAESARSVNALAYTMGQDVVFGAGQFAPETPQGKQLLAHELTHVVQQQSNLATMSTDQNNEVHDEMEANRVETQIMAGKRIPYIRPRPRALRRQGHGPALVPASPTTGSGSGRSSGLNLDRFTRFHFTFGDLSFDVNLPSSARARLPVALSRASNIVFQLDATTSGRFTFSATVNGIPHVRLRARAGVDVGSQQASAGLVIETTSTTCQAPSPAAVQSQLRRAGENLKNKILTVQNPPEGANDPVQVAQRWAELAGAISNVHQTIERARSSCRQVPRFSVELGARTPLGPFDPNLPPTNRDLNRAPFVGVTATLRF